MITIIALIMSLVGPRVLNYLSESKVKAAKIQMQSFSSALDLLYLDTGRYPVVRRRAGRAGEAYERACRDGMGRISKAAACRTILGASPMSIGRRQSAANSKSCHTGLMARKAGPERRRI